MAVDKRAEVLVNYKSGTQMLVRTSSFNVTKRGDGINVTWNNDTTPRPLLLGAGEIESVWVVKEPK